MKRGNMNDNSEKRVLMVALDSLVGEKQGDVGLSRASDNQDVSSGYRLADAIGRLDLLSRRRDDGLPFGQFSWKGKKKKG